jgi:hypothetical protein
MFLNDPLEALRPCRVIPDALRVYQRDGSAIADAETVGARPIDLVGQSEFSEPPLQIGPGFQARFARTTFRLGLIRTEKNMPLHAGDV